ncbi:MAG: TaqI-like C-terminal specificity domain-containing protein, partial [Nitrospirota bacterium]
YEPPPKGRYLILIPKGWTRDKMSHSRESGNPGTTGFRVKPGMTETSAWRWFSELYPAIANHLGPFAEKGKKRYDKGEYWWELRACDYYAAFEKPKIMWPEIAGDARFTYDDAGYYVNNKVFIISDGSHYLLGLLNSALLRFFIHNNCTDLQGNSYNFSGVFVSRTPIRSIDFKNPSEKAVHDKLVSLVERMLELNKRKAALPPSAEREKIEREIAITDEKIDDIVCGLYGVADGERARV